MGYFFLVLTIAFESAAIIFMKLSSGFENRSWAIVAIISYLASFIFLTLALKQMPAGIANAVWAGSSTVIVAILGIVVFKEQLNTMHIIFLILIIIGIIGLNLSKA